MSKIRNGIRIFSDFFQNLAMKPFDFHNELESYFLTLHEKLTIGSSFLLHLLLFLFLFISDEERAEIRLGVK